MKNLSLLILLLFITSCNNDIDDHLFIVPEPLVVTIVENDPEGINIVIVGDALDTSSETNRDLYLNLKKIEANALLNVEPFLGYKENFNIYGIYTKDTLDLDDADFSAVNKLTLNLKKNTHLILVSSHNVLWDRDGDGIGETLGYATGNTGVYRSGHPDIMIHEAGHAFAGLSDEYVELTGEEIEVLTEEELTYSIIKNGDLSYSPNLDTTNNLNEIKWKHFIGLEGYESVGAFEGGAQFFTFGVWKPEERSIMGSWGSHFNAPSREAIVKRIYEIKGMEYTFEKFLEKDTPQPRSLSRSLEYKNFKPLTGCVIK